MWNYAPNKIALIVSVIAVSFLIVFSFYNSTSESVKTLPVCTGTKLVIGHESGNGNLNNYYLYFNTTTNTTLTGKWVSNEPVAVNVLLSSQLWQPGHLFTFYDNGTFDNHVASGSYIIEFHGNESTVVTVMSTIELING